MKSYPIILMAVAGFCWSCEESKRFAFNPDDSLPPESPVFLRSEPLNGGARIFYECPNNEEDLLGVEVEYTNASGKPLCFAASYFNRSVDVLGFPQAGEYTVDLYAIDRSRNRSEKVQVAVEALESPVEMIAQRMMVSPAFNALMIRWGNPLGSNIHVYVDYSFVQNGTKKSLTTIFTSNQLTERRFIDSLKQINDNLLQVQVRVEDLYGNMARVNVGEVTLYADREIPKTGWSLLAAGEVMGGVTQTNGSENFGLMSHVIDGYNDADALSNFWCTLSAAPWNIIIDMGDYYELSRIVTHQRYSYDNTVRKAYYRYDNVFNYNFYAWNESSSMWEMILRHKINEPAAKNDEEYVRLGNRGDETYFYPENPRFTSPIRWVRYEAQDGKYLSEITLYGK